ncbi:MAG: UPF0179 family protein [Candidatus Nezhaarchaeota archaeon]|nr:UPF0179 family protein [Candidatus Nezhaarchaeota archaeon]
MSNLALEARRIVTLIGSSQARVGYRFVHLGPSKPCELCKLLRVCVGALEPGRMYEVVAVRRTRHDCPLHEGGVKVVDVVEAPVEVAIPLKVAVEGLIISYRPLKCGFKDCMLTYLCKPKWLRAGDRCRVVAVLEAGLPCPKKLSLAKARLARLPS